MGGGIFKPNSGKTLILILYKQKLGTWKLATARGLPYMHAAQDQA
jgi:hypothetical protein